ncbi:MAG TPA: long-chain fatty acid--CoA ligase [Acidimicrobiia bacterium]
MTAETTPHRVFEKGRTLADHPAYFVKRSGTWQPTTWRQYAAEVRAAAKSLIAVGIQPGDRVNILGFNRPEWVIFDVAAMAVGAVPAGIYTTNSPAECQYIIAHSEAPVVLVENHDQWAKVNEVRSQLPALRRVVLMSDAGPVDDDLVMSWDEFVASGAGVADADLDTRLEALQPDDLATLIYTSGTTGPPKGVMLSHDNLGWTAGQVMEPAGITASDRLVSYLPLSHIAEQSFTIHGAANAGYSVYYAESIEALADNLKEVEPTVFFAVPRVWERFYAGVTAELGHATGVKAKIAAWAQRVGRKVADVRNAGGEPGGALASQYKVASALVFAKVKRALGLGKVRFAVSGAAPVSKEILEFFSGLDILVYEVYGQSEDTGPTSINLPGMTKFGSVGPAYPGVEVKIADDGEVLVRGRNVFLGYFRDAEATKETLVDGWLHSGDLGEFDGDGFLTITGRKKDIIITAGGKNVAPKAFEGGLKNHPLVAEAVMIGDRRKYLTCVITLDDAAAEAYLKAHDLSGPAHESAAIHSELQQAIDAVNANFARVEQVKKFAVLARPLSIEAGELTPTLKVKRNKVAEHFAPEIEALYVE